MKIFPGRVSYLLVVVIAIISFIWMVLANITFPVRQLIEPAALIALLSLVVLLVNRMTYSDARTKRIAYSFGYLFQGIIFLEVSWVFIRLFDHVSMTSAFPYADTLLLNWDRALGFDWVAYFRFVEEHALINRILGDSYLSLSLVSFLAFFLLAFQRDLQRTRFFLETFLLTAVICTTAGMFFPAKAAVATYYGDATTMANLATLPGVYHVEFLERLRAGGPLVLDLDRLPGLVTFPSFHTAAGIILLAGFWRTKLFPIVLAYVTVMIASTPVFGGHYFVDLIGGAAVAVAVVSAFASLPFYRGLFRWAKLATGPVEPSPSHP